MNKISLETLFGYLEWRTVISVQFYFYSVHERTKPINSYNRTVHIFDEPIQCWTCANFLSLENEKFCMWDDSFLSFFFFFGFSSSIVLQVWLAVISKINIMRITCIFLIWFVIERNRLSGFGCKCLLYVVLDSARRGVASMAMTMIAENVGREKDANAKKKKYYQLIYGKAG